MPTSITELHNFLGFAGYYRQFVEGYAKDRPLHKLQKQMEKESATLGSKAAAASL